MLQSTKDFLDPVKLLPEALWRPGNVYELPLPSASSGLLKVLVEVVIIATEVDTDEDDVCILSTALADISTLSLGFHTGDPTTIQFSYILVLEINLENLVLLIITIWLIQ